MKKDSEETKETSGLKLALSKYEYDLYHEEDDVVNPIIRVKRFSLPNKNERWKIYEDNKVVLILEGNKFSKKEKEFLRGVNGINLLLQGYKNGVSSLYAFKKQVKEKLEKEAIKPVPVRVSSSPEVKRKRGRPRKQK